MDFAPPHPYRTLALTLLAALTLTACGNSPNSKTPATPATGSTTSAVNATLIDRVELTLDRHGKLAQDSYYNCLLNGHAQGLPLNQIIEECSTKLLEDADAGFGGPLGDIGRDTESYFDPASVQASCSSGDPTRAGATGVGQVPGYGNYSWGRGQVTQDSRGVGTGKGMNAVESFKAKQAAADAADAALKDFDKAQAAWVKAKADLKAAEATGDAAKVKEAQDKLDAAKKDLDDKTSDAEKKKKEAEKDPNNGGITRGTGEPSQCEQALQAARELLRECNRNGWKSTQCQQLNAKMNGCPDPTLILVDPEQGYACGAKPDAEAVAKAWGDRCEQTIKYAPGTSPCEPLQLDGDGRFGSGRVGDDFCNDPRAYVEGDAAACQVSIELGSYFGKPDIHQIIIIALEKIGGPLIVLPNLGPKPPPGGGPDPRPGPIS
ncbi:MAG: hypothetical protein WAP35_10095 [Solirubrobacterales bacterium]